MSSIMRLAVLEGRMNKDGLTEIGSGRLPTARRPETGLLPCFFSIPARCARAPRWETSRREQGGFDDRERQETPRG
jgi:hypothetical protein